MELKSDSHFFIGDQHLRQGKPCQDYAVSECFSDFCVAVVSDGCSSGGHTDIGARLTSLAALEAIKKYFSTSESKLNENTPDEINNSQSIIACGAYQMLGLTLEDMLATCLYIYVGASEGFIHILGDGVIATKAREGQIKMMRFDWSENAPLYPIYREDCFRSFTEFHGGNPNALKLKSEEWLYVPKDGFINPRVREFSISEGIKGFTKIISVEKIKNENLEFIAIFSDGATQVENLDWKNAVLELLSFKTTAGSFAKRRGIAFTKQRKPIDDLSFAVIQIIEKTDKEIENVGDTNRII